MPNTEHAVLLALGAIVCSSTSFAVASVQEKLRSGYQRLGSFQDRAQCSRFAGDTKQAQHFQSALSHYLPGLGGVFEIRSYVTERLTVRVLRVQQDVWTLTRWTVDFQGVYQDWEGPGPVSLDMSIFRYLTISGDPGSAVSPGLALLSGHYPYGLDPAQFDCRPSLGSRINCAPLTKGSVSTHWLNPSGQIVRSKFMDSSATTYCDYSPRSVHLQKIDLALPIPGIVTKLNRWRSDLRVHTPEIIKAALAGDPAAFFVTTGPMVAYAMGPVTEDQYLKIYEVAVREKFPGAGLLNANLYTERAAQASANPAHGMSTAALREKRLAFLVAAANTCDFAALRDIARGQYFGPLTQWRWSRKQAACGPGFSVFRTLVRPSW